MELVLDNIMALLPYIFSYLPFKKCYYLINKDWYKQYTIAIANYSIKVQFNRCIKQAKQVDVYNLDASGCILFLSKKIRKLKIYSFLERTQILKIFNMRGNIIDLTPISIAKNLQELDIGWNEHIYDLSPLTILQNLRILNMSQCYSIRDITPLKFCKKLNELFMPYVCNVIDFTSLTHTKSIKILNIRGNKLSDLTSLAGIYKLDIDDCRNINDLTPIVGVYTLNIDSCYNINDLTPLSTMPLSLHELNISYCSQLTNLAPLTLCLNLRKLNITACTQFIDLNPVKHVTKLNIDLCTNITNLSIMIDIHYLSMCGCTQITSLNVLEPYKNLYKLNIYCCPQIHNIKYVRNISKIDVDKNKIKKFLKQLGNDYIQHPRKYAIIKKGCCI